MEEWKIIEDFPEYQVSDQGRVYSTRYDRYMQQNQNQQSIPQVGLNDRSYQVRRSVPLLVARAFLPPAEQAHFDTPIQLNGDRTDCRAENLMWRPRWFAVRYHRQFMHMHAVSYSDAPVRSVMFKTEHENPMAAAKHHGLLVTEVSLSAINGGRCFPTWDIFEFID